jgi:hypothetical protein
MNPRAGAADPLEASPVPFRPRPATIAPMPGATTPARPLVRRCGAPTCTPLGSACRWALHREPCPHHKDADSTGRCRATCRPLPGTKRRERCLAWPLTGTPFCRTHTPERIEQRREQDSLRRAAETRQRKLAGLKPVRDLLALFLEMLDAELERPGTGGPVLATYLRTVQP